MFKAMSMSVHKLSIQCILIGLNEFDLTAIMALQTVWHSCKEHKKTNFQRSLSLEIRMFVVTETCCVSKAYQKKTPADWSEMKADKGNDNATHLMGILRPVLMHNNLKRKVSI